MIQLPEHPPRPVAKAAVLLAERESDVAAAKARVEEAKQAVGRAVSEDRALLADSLDAGRADPGTPREDEARALLADAERHAAGQELRRERAQAALDAALAAAMPAWEESARRAVMEAEGEALRLLDQLESAVDERAHRRLALHWVQARRQGSKLPRLDHLPATASTVVINPQAGPATYAIADLLDHVRGGLEQASLAAEQARQVEREQPQLHVA